MVRRSLIVIGTDGVGKTPISKALAEHYGKPYFKFANEVQALKDAGHPGRHMLWFDYGLTQFLSQTGTTMVSDRGYLCELVYATYFGRETDMGLIHEIDRAHENLGTAILLLWDSKIESRLKEDPHVAAVDIPLIQRSYLNIVPVFTCCDVITYDVALSAQEQTYDDRLKIDVPNIIGLLERK